ncbi:forkhead box protein J1 [Monodelphis domestica]|uniref:Forkhead box J1 n=1 Tax=Monodelphis domestica TaxID=13616 RepID=F7FGZ0_MONDO|nr:forkhead box protein J1 [Monodelphis domestica]XP_016286122.1 forkhead box protein J1 [Monodelphis domestica]XP_044528129.1 forkhead box protein J1 [Gracilinanus agilis]
MAENWLRLSGTGAMEEGGLEEPSGLDDSLTSLQWLQEFSILNAKAPSLPPGGTDPHGYHQVPGSVAPGSPLAADPACLGQPHTPGKPTSSCTSRSAPNGLQAPPPDDVDYATNPHVKPPYSYATLICMAMQASKATKITLSAIYKWITDNFCYFRHADPTWQNSIRHNLSLNKCFIKVPREKDEPGKGGFWRIDPQYAERLLSGAFKKRRLPPVHIHPAFARQTPQEPETGTWAAPLAVNPEAQQLLREFEEATGGETGWGAGEVRPGHKRKQPLPKRVAKAPRPTSTTLLSQEEQGELEPLKGDFDWEAIFDAGTLGGELGALEALDLSPPLSPATRSNVDLTVHGHHIDCPATWGPSTEPATDGLDFDETFLATSFLQHPWDESHGSCLPPEPLFEAGDATLAVDLNDWASVGAFL